MSRRIIFKQRSGPEEQRRPRRTALFLLGLLSLGAALFLMLPAAWQRTMRHEAYLPELETQAKQTSYDGPLLALVGARLMEAGEYRAAREILLHALAAGEQNDAIRCTLAAAIAATGDRTLALGHLQMGLQSLPESALLTAALRRARATDPAAPPVTLALEISPSGPQPLLDLYAGGSFLNGLVTWWGRRNPERSGFATRQQWVLEQPEDARVQRLWGLALLRNRRPVEAGVALRRAFDLDPKSPEVNLAVAEALAQQGQLRPAVVQYLTALKLRPDWLSALLGLGRACQKSGLTQIAVRSYRKATVVAPDSLEAWIGLGHNYQLTASGSAYDKSVTAYARAAHLAPDSTDFLNDYALSLYKLSRHKEAEAMLRQRLNKAPGDARCHYLLGMVLMNANPTPARQAEAEVQTREALRLRPDDVPANVQLAQLLIEQGKATEAVSLLKDIARRSPYNRRALFLLAQAYRGIGQMALAGKVAAQADALYRVQQQIADLEERERENLLDRAVHERLANLYEQVGAKDKAQQQRATIRLLRSDPKSVAQARQDYDRTLNQVLGSP